MRGSSVLNPYLMPNQKNLRYMVERGYITLPQRGSADAETARDAATQE